MVLTRTLPVIAVLYTLSALALHWTAEAVITSPHGIVAAIDSKEVTGAYLNDGTSITEDSISCKARQIGPYYVLIAGIARAANGFDALREIAQWHNDGDSLDVFAQRLTDSVTFRLAPILEALRAADKAAFNTSFRNQDVLQFTLLGVERSQTRIVIVAFHASQSGNGRVSNPGT